MSNQSKNSNNQQGANIQDLQVTGGESSVFNIGNTTQNIYDQKPVFYKVKNLDKYNFISPKVTSELIKILKKNRILILGGSIDVYKDKLAMHLAWQLSEQISSTNTQKLVVEAWRNSSDPQNIDIEIQETEKSTIFILSEIKPQNILGSEFSKIQETSISGEHYVIATTNIPRAAWRSSTIESFWYGLSIQSVEDSKDLLNKDTENTIREEYYNLESREQLLALGLSLFDGLYDDQFFAALEEVVESAWQKRDDSLHALDYYDLDNLHRFFDFDDQDGMRPVVKVIPPKRKILLKVALEKHRRQVLSALPVLVNLVKNTVKRYDRELYELSGSPIRLDKLRNVISETISSIGLIDSDAVQDTLLNLAADQDTKVRSVAAQSLASWHEAAKGVPLSDHHFDEQLFATLQRWEVITKFDKKDAEVIQESKNNIRSTIAMTIAYAAIHDSDDELADGFCELLKTLIADRSQSVRATIFQNLMPIIVPRHLIRIRGILKNLLANHDSSHQLSIRLISGSSELVIWDLINAVAYNLALTYNRDLRSQSDVVETLNIWSKECQSVRPQKVNILKVTSRELLLATVVLTYGEMGDDGSLSPEQILNRLVAILSEELHPYIRRVILFSIGLQAYRNFERIENQLYDLVTKISTEEREKLAVTITDIYLEQRISLSGSNRFVTIDNKKYPVWLNSKRKLTTIEEVVIRWLKDDQNVMAQQVATLASANFAKRLDQEEERQIKQLREGRDSLEVSEKPVYAEPIVFGQPPKDWYLGKLIPWLATRNAEDYRTSIRNLLPEGLRQRRISRDVMEFVLRKWVDASDDDVKTISGRLKPGLWLAENLGWFIALGIGSTLTLVWLAATNLSQVRKTEPIIQKIEPSDPNIIIVSDRIGVEVSDTTSFNTGNLTIKISEGATPDDYLGIRNQGKNSGEIGVNGSEVTYGGTVIGLFKGGSLKEPLVISFNSNAKLPVVQALLQNITYINTATTLSEGSRKVEFQITDEAGKVSQLLSRTVFVTHDNIAPTLVTPESLAANENEPIKVSGITISDSDSTKKFTVTLSVSNGSITVKDSVPKGIVVSDISNNNTKNVSFTGSLDKIKATLTDASAIIYKGTDDDNFKVTINDGGQDIPGDPITTLVWPTKAKDAKTTSKDIKISVALLNKPPVITIPERSKTVDENKELIISGIGIDDDTKDMTVTLSADHGTVTVKPDVAKGVVIDNISNNKTKKVVITGELAKIKSTLSDTQAIVYKGDQDFSGNDSLTIVVNDKGRGKTDKLSIIVNRIKRPPILKFLTDIATATPPSPPVPSPNVTEIKISKQESLDAVQNYLQAKGSIFAPPFSREIAAKVSTGTLYLDITKSEGSIDSLIKNQQFYRYGRREVKVLDYFVSDSNKAFIDLIVIEEAARFKNGNLEVAPSVSTKQYRYEVRKDNNILKVFDYKEIRRDGE